MIPDTGILSRMMTQQRHAVEQVIYRRWRPDHFTRALKSNRISKYSVVIRQVKCINLPFLRPVVGQLCATDATIVCFILMPDFSTFQTAPAAGTIGQSKAGEDSALGPPSNPTWAFLPCLLRRIRLPLGLIVHRGIASS
jgi:hypothetical protein